MEGRAASVASRRGDRSGVRTDDCPCDEQTEAGSWHLLCDDARRAEETIEHELCLIRAETDSRVAHLEHGHAGRRSDAYLDAAALRRELDRVRDQVVEQLEESSLVALDHHR